MVNTKYPTILATFFQRNYFKESTMTSLLVDYTQRNNLISIKQDKKIERILMTGVSYHKGVKIE